MNLILLVLLVVLLIGALPAWPYSAGWGYYPSGALGTVLIPHSPRSGTARPSKTPLKATRWPSVGLPTDGSSLPPRQ